MEELPLGMDEATAFLWPQVWVQRDGDFQEGFLAEDPRVIVRDSVIVEDVDPAAMTGDGCSEILQYNMRIHNEIADCKDNHVNYLKSSQAADLIQEFLKCHWDWVNRRWNDYI